MSDLERLDLWSAFQALADRPECEHGLNGPCSECGPSLTLTDAVEWRRELRTLIGDEESTA